MGSSTVAPLLALTLAQPSRTAAVQMRVRGSALGRRLWMRLCGGNFLRTRTGARQHEASRGDTWPAPLTSCARSCRGGGREDREISGGATVTWRTRQGSHSGHAQVSSAQNVQRQAACSAHLHEARRAAKHATSACDEHERVRRQETRHAP